MSRTSRRSGTPEVRLGRNNLLKSIGPGGPRREILCPAEKSHQVVLAAHGVVVAELDERATIRLLEE
jgi:hypothetical protein